AARGASDIENDSGPSCDNGRFTMTLLALLLWQHPTAKGGTMSKESAKEFVRRLLDDGEFLARFASIKGGERPQQAAAEGFDFTTEELEEAKAEHLQEAGHAGRKPPKGGNGDIQPLYGVVDTWEA
ncbi:MAG: Nif11-like leader peptide family natural product precursor, partial [Acidimicrobiales bacterium]